MRRLLRPAAALLLCACSATLSKKEAVSPPSGAHRGLYAVFVTARGNIEARLFEDDAPKTVEDFSRRARRGDFDGTALARAVPGFLVQGGVRSSDAPLGLETSSGRGFAKEGRLAAPAREGMSVPGEFFITLAALPWLDGRNAVFGEVTSGLESLQEAALAPRLERDPSGRFSDRPESPLRIEKVLIEERR